MILPFMFLEICGPTTEEIRKHLVMTACQMIMRRSPQGIIQFHSAGNKSGNVRCTILVETGGEAFRTGPHFNAALFHGYGKIKKEEDLFLFQADFLVDPAKMGIDLMKTSLTDPWAFMNRLGKDFCWQ
ncbi:MAG: hypothetical protein WC619_05710 [Patescibacteria group bacterium]